MNEHLRDPSGRAKAAVTAVLIWLIADFAYAISGLYTIWALEGFGPLQTSLDYDQVDRVAGIVAGILIATMIVSAIFVSRWIMRVNRNAQQWSANVTITPGWNVGWFFVPVASLYKPFEGIRQTWQASIDPASPESVDVPIFMRVWWGFFLAMNVVGNVTFRLDISAKTAEQFITVRWIDVARLLVDIPTTILLIMLIRQLTAIQRQAILTERFPGVDG